MRKTFKFLYPTAILAAICLIVSLALSSTNMITKAKIEKIEADNANAARKRVLAADEYKNKTIGKTEYYEAVKGGKVIGFIFTTSANGYGGEVKVMTAILNDEDRTIKTIEILDVSNETPGLGQNAKEEKFYGQFSGLHSKVNLVKTEPDKENNEIKALTSATYTSTAVTDAVNEALELCSKIKTETEGEKDEK